MSKVVEYSRKNIDSDRYLRLAENMMRCTHQLRYIPIKNSISEIVHDHILFGSASTHADIEISLAILVWMIMKKLQPSSMWYVYIANMNGIMWIFPISVRDGIICTRYHDKKIRVSMIYPIYHITQVYTVLERPLVLPKIEDPLCITEYIQYLRSCGVDNTNLTRANLMMTRSILDEASKLPRVTRYKRNVIKVKETSLLYKSMKTLDMLLSLNTITLFHLYPSNMIDTDIMIYAT